VKHPSQGRVLSGHDSVDICTFLPQDVKYSKGALGGKMVEAGGSVAVPSCEKGPILGFEVV
jgi:hypothetical protein